MKRFGYNADGFSSLDESENGEWVRYEDHAADRAALVAQLDRVTGYLDTERKCNEHREADIERLEEALETARAQVAELTRERDEARKLATGYRQSAEHECAEVTRLIDALAAAEKRTRTELARVDAAESECAALRAEVERQALETVKERVRARDALQDLETIRGVHADARRGYAERVAAAKSSLAAANALLDEMMNNPSLMAWPAGWADRVRAHLTAQPATAPDYDPITAPVPPGDMNGPHGDLPQHAAPATFAHPGAEQVFNRLQAARVTRAEAEQRVLDALDAVPVKWLEWWREWECSGNTTVNEFARAELARREASRG